MTVRDQEPLLPQLFEVRKPCYKTIGSCYNYYRFGQMEVCNNLLFSGGQTDFTTFLK